jgi:5-methylthioribose kinase
VPPKFYEALPVKIRKHQIGRIMDLQLLRRLLTEKGLLDVEGYQCLPLTGGVSSEIYLVKDRVKSLVVKQALARLKVNDTWEADIRRNRVEQDFIRYIQQKLPTSVPEIVYSDRENNFFVMEYLGASCKNWKSQLLGANFNPQTAQDAAHLLATLHTFSYNDPEARKIFDTSVNFRNLRTAPYLLQTAERNPELKDLIYTEAGRLLNHRECLVHGDFSPKNILVDADRIVLLDHEVVWFGDPAFDVAFMLTHLHLKQLVHHFSYMKLPDLSQIFWDHYFMEYTHRPAALKKRVNKLWLLILLARVDGKSPVEYLAKEPGKQKLIKSFVYEALKSGILGRKQLKGLWYFHLNNFR